MSFESATLVSFASAGINIYPSRTEKIVDSTGNPYALVYDINPSFFEGGYQPHIYGTYSPIINFMKTKNWDHTDPQTWDFVRSKYTNSRGEPQVALMIPSHYCGLAGSVFVLNTVVVAGLTKATFTDTATYNGILAIYAFGKSGIVSPIYINTNAPWIKS